MTVNFNGRTISFVVKIIWEFRVRRERLATFKQIYGPSGEWAQLFRRSPDYMGTELLADLELEERFLTIDAWRSRDTFQQFKKLWSPDYELLDEHCEGLMEQEALIGS